MTILLVTKLYCSSSVCMCDSRMNHSSRFVPVAGSKIEHVLPATGTGKNWYWKPWHVTGFWYQLARNCYQKPV